MDQARLQKKNWEVLKIRRIQPPLGVSSIFQHGKQHAEAPSFRNDGCKIITSDVPLVYTESAVGKGSMKINSCNSWTIFLSFLETYEH